MILSTFQEYLETETVINSEKSPVIEHLLDIIAELSESMDRFHGLIKWFIIICKHHFLIALAQTIWSFLDSNA